MQTHLSSLLLQDPNLSLAILLRVKIATPIYVSLLVSSRDRLGVPANGSGGTVPYNTKQSRRWTPHSLTILARRIPHPYGRPRRGHSRAMSARLVCICENSPHGQPFAVGGPAASHSAPEHPELHRAGTLPIPRIDSYRAAPSEERVLADRDFTQGALFVETRIDGSHLPIQTGRRSTEPLWHRSRRGAKLFRQPRGVGNNHRRGESSRGSVALNLGTSRAPNKIPSNI